MAITLEEGTALLDRWRQRQFFTGHWYRVGTYVGEAALACRFPGLPGEGVMELVHLATDSGEPVLWFEVYAGEEDNPEPVAVDLRHFLTSLFIAGVTPEMFRDEWQKLNMPPLPLQSGEA